MKHGFLKVVIMLIVITLFMALTGCGIKQRVVLTVVNPQYPLKGKADQILLTVDAEIKSSGRGRAELYLNTLNALQESKLKKYADAATAFRDDYTIINVNEKDGDVIVDFSSRNLSGSDAAEQLLISQIVETLMESYDEVKSVSFTVDGEEAETLMGHVDITERFTAPLDIEK